MNEQHLPKISPPTEPPSKNNGRQHKNIKITLPAEPKTKPNKNRGRKFQRRIALTDPILNRQNDQKFQSGYKGEAHIYEILISLLYTKFKKVVWNALTDNEIYPYIKTVGGKTYHINEINDHYDLYAEDYFGGEYYFEVKSTIFSESQIYLSKEQINLANDMTEPNKHHFVAVVLDVNSSPKAIFFKKTE